MNVFDLVASLSLDKSSYDDGLSDASKSASSFGSKVGTAVKTGAKAIAAIGTAAIGVGAAFTNAAGNVASSGDEIDKSSQKLGVAADQYQTLAFAAEHSGFSTSVLTTAAKNLSKTDFSGNLYDAIGYIQTLGTEEERTAAASEMFGAKAAQQMQALINGSQSIDEYYNNLESLGGLMSNESVSASAAYEDSLTDMQTAFSGVKNSIISDMLPSFTTLMNGITSLITGSDNAEELLTEGVEQLITNISEKIPMALNIVTTIANSILQSAPTIIQSLSTGIIDSLPTLIPVVSEIVIQIITSLVELLPDIIEAASQIIVSLATGISNSLPNLIPTIISVITEIVDTLTNTDSLDTIFDAALQIIIGLATGIIDSLPELIDKIPQIIEAIVTTLSNNIPKIIEAGITLFVSLIAALPDIIVSIVKAVPQIITSLVTGFSEGISKIQEVGKNLMSGLWEGIKEKWNSLKDSVSQLGEGIVNKFKDVFGIHSPSRVMKNEVGKFLGLGLGEGLTEGWQTEYDNFRNNLESDLMIDTKGSIEAPQISEVEKQQSTLDYITDTISTVFSNAFANFEDLITKAQGDIYIPVYLGNEMVDTVVVGSNQRVNYRSGGRV